MLQIKSKYVDRGGIILLVLTIVFSFFYSMGYTLDGSQYDYMYYMHLVDDAEYAEDTLVVGTLLLYKPLWYLFGNTIWLWNRFHWFLNFFVICIPYLFLLNNRQRKKYAYVQALAVLLFCVTRCGCEPPRLVLLFALFAVTLFVRYVKLQNSKLILFISLLLALIAFCRFPSLFVYPLFVVAVMLTARRKIHSLLIIVLPVIFFCLLVSFTNGSIIAYISDMKSSFVYESNSSPSHSVYAIFMSEVDSIVELLKFSVIAIVPFILLIWKKKNKIWWMISPVVVLLALNMIRINPIPRWACAIAIVICFFYLVENKASLKSFAMVLLVVLVPMFTSIGSNCGFGSDFVSVAFLPFLAADMKSINTDSEYFSIKSIDCSFDKGLLYSAFFLVVITLFLSNLNVRFKNLREAYYEDGRIRIVNAEALSPNLKNMYFGEKKLARYLEAEKEYKILEKEKQDVIFWGMDAHIMSLANDKWPITRLWKVSSVTVDNAAMNDLGRYANLKRPYVIDMEENENTEKTLLSLGYQRIQKKYYSVYK